MKTLTKNNTWKIKNSVQKFAYCFLIFGLTGCADNDVSDLLQYIETVKSEPKGSIPALPEIKVAESFIFNPEDLRDPFRLVEKRALDDSMHVASGSGIVPDTTRRQEELEEYPLDTLEMVGTLTMGDGLWGLIKASDGTIHRVQKGNYMGQNYGEIIRILGDRVELMEIIPDQPGAWREQQASLQLAE